ncbi:MAG: paraquat-inducible protein A [Aliarcobacter sp.]|nr:paraquat-inducible protein A [Aliarcobacter sp.]
MVLISCKNCHKMYEKENFDDFVCTRCNHVVRKRIKNSLQVSLALTICAILLYIPAMLYPIMEVTKLGVKIESTILEGVVSFLDMESYFIAIVVFTASVIIPMIKLIGLLFIFLSLKTNVRMQNNRKILIFKFVEAIGKWSMIDIYVVALLASIIQLDEIFNIKGGIAATSFALMVILTMIAANRFDTRIIWDEYRNN